MFIDKTGLIIDFVLRYLENRELDKEFLNYILYISEFRFISKLGRRVTSIQYFKTLSAEIEVRVCKDVLQLSGELREEERDIISNVIDEFFYYYGLLSAARKHFYCFEDFVQLYGDEERFSQVYRGTPVGEEICVSVDFLCRYADRLPKNFIII